MIKKDSPFLLKGWDITSGAYFSFITLLTIGFGDYVSFGAGGSWIRTLELRIMSHWLYHCAIPLLSRCGNKTT
jgi:Ion channel